MTLHLRDGNVQGLDTGNSGDTVDIQRPGSIVNLGTVNTKGNFAKNKQKLPQIISDERILGQDADRSLGSSCGLR